MSLLSRATKSQVICRMARLYPRPKPLFSANLIVKTLGYSHSKKATLPSMLPLSTTATGTPLYSEAAMTLGRC